MDTTVSTDVVVVGARCAGAAVARCLARLGHRVVVVDRSTFPSDMPLSTLLIWHAGVDILHAWGLLEPLRRAGTPLLTELSLDLGELVLRGTPPGAVVNAAIAPRRIVLDQVLLDAAVAAGADVRQGVSFEDVVKDADGRVTGIRCRQADGSTLTVSARCVVGADGRTSDVARAVGSTAYHEFPVEKCSTNVYALYSGVSAQGAEFYSRPARMAYAWETNDRQLMTGLILPGHEERPSRAALEDMVFEELGAMAPGLATRLRQGRREVDWRRVSIPTQCRKPSGAGWALVGDAGLTFDPITAAGMTNAFRDADCLAGALHSALAGERSVDDALADYATRRDASAVRWHLFAQQMAELAPPTDDIVRLFTALAGNQPQTDRYFGLFGQTVLPADFFGPENMKRLLATATATPEHPPLTP
jgi:2-polyprenyl-6-methoxyphenol hydroxylase-like FAD-dependent oxidoreductase